MKPVVCLFTDSLDPSGVGTHMLSLAAELGRRYHVVLVAPPIHGGYALLERASEEGLEVLPLPVRGERLPWVVLRDWLKFRRVSVFHGHAGIGWEGHDGLYAARAAGVPVIVRTEHLPYLIPKDQGREHHRRLLAVAVDRLICVSEGARASFLEVGVDPRKLRVVRNGIRSRRARADRDAVRSRLGLPREAELVLTVARFTDQKGHRFLLGAAPAVLKARPDAHLVLVGEGPLESELRETTRAAGLERRVHFLGPREDVPELLAAADVFVLPSLFEGFPIAVLEAMAAGLPVVATKVCGTTEAVVDGVTGCLVEPKRPPALARAILEVLGQPKLAARLGAGGRARVEREFGAARMALETAAIYDELLGASPARRAAPASELEWRTA